MEITVHPFVVQKRVVKSKTGPAANARHYATYNSDNGKHT